MDEPITKRLIISGLTPSISVDDLSRRLTSFGTVKAADGFGLLDGVGNPRNFGYVTLDTTVGKLAKCMNLLSGSTWKGAKLRFGEAKPDFKERIALENKQAAEEPPKKKRKRFGGMEAEDMSLVTPENAATRPGWKVSSLGRITKPVKMRPEHPLPDISEDKPKTKPGVVKFSDVSKVAPATEKKKKKKRVKDPDTRARRKVIDMPKYGSTHLKGMFLDIEVPMPATRPERYQDRRIDEVTGDSDDSESSEGRSTSPKKSEVSETKAKSVQSMLVTDEDSPLPTIASEGVRLEAVTHSHPAGTPQSPSPLASRSLASETLTSPGERKVSISPPPTDTTIKTIPPTNSSVDVDVEREKAQSLNLLNSLFGEDADDCVGKEDIDSDIDVSELVKGDRLLDDEQVAFEIVAKNAPVKIFNVTSPTDESDEESEQMDVDQLSAPASNPVKEAQPKTLKDLFAPREEDVQFSLLGHLDLDIDLDDDPLATAEASQQTSEPLQSVPLPAPVTLQTHPSQAPLVLDPKQALFFPLPRVGGSFTRARQRDVYDLAKDNGWNWRDPAVGFYRTGTEEDIRKRWEESKGDLTRDWKRRSREAGKVNRRKRGGVEGDEV